MDKLAVRTSTVVNNIVLPNPPPKEDTLFSKADLVMYTGAGALGFILGTIITALVR